MILSRPYRALALPALAILVPSAFIAVLASEWLALEHENAQLRGAEAAAASLVDLRRGFSAMIADTARQILPRVAEESPASPDADSAWPPIVAEAFLVDGIGRPAGSRPAIGSGVRSASSQQPAALLAAGTEAWSAGRLADADQASARLLACCGKLRDEFGVAYATYAAWQQLKVNGLRPDPRRPAAVVRQLRELIDRGDLTQPQDVVSIRLIAEKLPDDSGAAALVGLAEQKAVAEAQRRERIGLAESWVHSLDWTSASSGTPVLVGRWGSGPTSTLVAAWRTTADEHVVLVLDLPSVGQWVSRWSDTRSFFVYALAAASVAPAPTDTVYTASLFDQAPAFRVSVRRGPNDVTADRKRERLFMTTAGAFLILTFVTGYFAARDVFRELRMVSLRSTFLAGVTHEIKTPLTSIRLLAETVHQKRVPPHESDEMLATIVSEAEHLTDLVDNALGTSRIESGTRTYQPRLVSVADVVRSTRQRFEYTLAKEGFTLVESIASAPIWVHADPEALAQAVLNLLSNATKYSGASREIRLSVNATDRQAIVSVADDGVGVPTKDQARIFKSFYRARGTSGETTGTGLGLALVRHFAEAHGGRVTLQSNPGRGSTFTIALPLVSDPEEGHASRG